MSPTRSVKPPPVDRLLVDLDAYETDDSAGPGELEVSLDHGPVGYDEVRRRLILDEDGFAQVEVTVATFPAGSGGGEDYLGHLYGPAPRSPERVGGEEMLLVEADPHSVLAWVTPTFVMTFERRASVTMEWLRRPRPRDDGASEYSPDVNPNSGDRPAQCFF